MKELFDAVSYEIGKRGDETIVKLPFPYTVYQAEKALIVATIDHLGGEKARRKDVAKALGITRSALYNKCQRYGILPKPPERAAEEQPKTPLNEPIS